MNIEIEESHIPASKQKSKSSCRLRPIPMTGIEIQFALVPKNYYCRRGKYPPTPSRIRYPGKATELTTVIENLKKRTPPFQRLHTLCQRPLVSGALDNGRIIVAPTGGKLALHQAVSMKYPPNKNKTKITTKAFETHEQPKTLQQVIQRQGNSDKPRQEDSQTRGSTKLNKERNEATRAALDEKPRNPQVWTHILRVPSPQLKTGKAKNGDKKTHTNKTDNAQHGEQSEQEKNGWEVGSAAEGRARKDGGGVGGGS